MKDLTKILKEGDEVFCRLMGRGAITSVSGGKSSFADILPIEVEFEAGKHYYTKEGRLTTMARLPSLYPIDQAIPAPQWPDAPQTFTWEGEEYEAGEWVAAKITVEFGFTWRVMELVSVANSGATLQDEMSICHSRKIRKLSSFNK